MAKRKESTHIVFKIEDALKYLSNEDRERLATLIFRIETGRSQDGKKLNRYYICNADEPYADKVLQAILEGEDYKEAYAKACEYARDEQHYFGIYRTDAEVEKEARRMANRNKYRKKPAVIEAIQWTGDNANEVAMFAEGKAIAGVFDKAFCIHTLEGIMKASIGDYIIKGIKGEFYPCKPDIFEKTYELAE